MNQQTIALALIKDHIVYSRLYYGLIGTGLDADDFVIDLADTIFQFMGLQVGEDSEKRFGEFLGCIEKITRFDAASWRGEVEALAHEAYALLMNWKEKA
jgi:hypothetical protein